MWDQVFTIDKRLIGGRTQFIDSIGNDNKQVIEQKNLYIVEREISFPGITEPITFILSGLRSHRETVACCFFAVFRFIA